MDIVERDLRELILAVWHSLVGLTIECSEHACERLSPGSDVLATVHITGGWRGTVTVECSLALARKIAASMFRMTEAQVADVETFDALGEIANVISGNVKAATGLPCELTLPTVAHGAGLKVSVLESQRLTRVGFTSQNEPLEVSVFEPRGAGEPDCRDSRHPG